LEFDCTKHRLRLDGCRDLLKQQQISEWQVFVATWTFYWVVDSQLYVMDIPVPPSLLVGKSSAGSYWQALHHGEFTKKLSDFVHKFRKKAGAF